MLSIAPASTIFLHTDATDMRKSFTGLCGIIRGVFGEDPADGSLFLFVNKRRDRIKALRWEGDGFVIWYKRLEQGMFEVVPPKLVVVRTGIPKLACRKHEACGVVEPARPVGLVEGNRYDTSIAAQIVTHKYSYHLPIYRQQDIFASCGWTPARSTLLNILRAAAERITGLVAHLREVVRAGPIIGTDDTTVTLLTPKDLPPLDPLDPKSARTREVIAAAHAEARTSITARMWAYRGVTVPLNVFDFTVSRHRDGPEIFLDGFSGKLMADCYSGYDAVQTASDGRIVRAACVAHARRKVFNARANHPTHAAVLLSMFQQLYDIEDRTKTCSSADRQALRQEEAKPIWERMREYINGVAVQDVLPKDSFGQALTYLRNQFDPLLVYLDDGLMPIDNNETEQLMKQVAIGRKNWLFIGEFEPVIALPISSRSPAAPCGMTSMSLRT